MRTICAYVRILTTTLYVQKRTGRKGLEGGGWKHPFLNSFLPAFLPSVSPGTDIDRACACTWVLYYRAPSPAKALCCEEKGVSITRSYGSSG